MKRNFRFSAIISKLCVALMAFLGYSCDNISGDMYGTPTGSWEIKGEVTDEGVEPVSNAIIKVTFPDVNSSEYSLAETRTNEDGDYLVSKSGDYFSSLKVVCIPDDETLKADSTRVDFKGQSIATVNFKLKKKL